MERKKLKKLILTMSEGLISTLIDFVLFEIFYGLELTQRSPSSKGASMAGEAALNNLEKINYQQIKNALRKLREKGFIKQNLEITEEGQKRILGIIPTYSERKWDGKWYLVIFDIPEDRKKDREFLRYLLKKLGFGRLQDSVWVSPYNYLGDVKEVIEEADLSDFVIFSITEELGTERAKILAQRIWDLEKINEEYREFVEKYKKRRKAKRRANIIFEYLGILKQDPQLPKELLPEDWIGEEGYRIYKNLTTSLKLHY